MKKILVFVDWYVPGYRAGGPIRSVKNIVDHLKDQAEFYIITRDTDYQSTSPYTDVVSDTWNEFETGVHVYYISVAALHKQTITRLITEKEWDTVYLNGIYSWFFSILPLWLLRKSSTRTLIAPRGMLAAGALGVKSHKKKAFLILSRLLNLYEKASFHATHPGEAEQISRYLNASAPVYTVPNLPALIRTSEWSVREKKKGEVRLVSVARISPEKNTKFAIEILSRIPATAKIVFHLYGPINDLAYWKQCQECIASLPPHIEVKHMGSLPNERVAGTLPQYHLMLLPSLGENFGHIIVEALGAATPVLLSDQTPWNDVESKGAGWALPLQKRESFAQAIIATAAMDQQAYSAFSQQAFAFAAEVLKTDELLQQYQKLLNLFPCQ